MRSRFCRPRWGRRATPCSVPRAPARSDRPRRVGRGADRSSLAFPTPSGLHLGEPLMPPTFARAFFLGIGLKRNRFSRPEDRLAPWKARVLDLVGCREGWQVGHLLAGQGESLDGHMIAAVIAEPLGQVHLRHAM